jgi:hypothetical protein
VGCGAAAKEGFITPTLAIQFAIVGLAINFLPAIIAAARRHRFLAIFLLNLLLAVMSLVGSAFGEDLIRQLKQPPYYSYYSYYAYHHYGLDPALLPRVYIGFVVATVLAWLALLIWDDAARTPTLPQVCRARRRACSSLGCWRTDVVGERYRAGRSCRGLCLCAAVEAVDHRGPCDRGRYLGLPLAMPPLSDHCDRAVQRISERADGRSRRVLSPLVVVIHKV